MTRLRWWLPAASLGVLGIGFLVLGAYSIAEALANPGYSLVDAYWRGRLPWMGIAEALIVGGATACAVIGAVAALWAGGAWRRILVIPPLLPIALWWFVAIGMSSMRATPCEIGTPCPAPGPDPWAFAYSSPETTALFLILPALFIVLVALGARTGAGLGESA
ncbi:MAG: hypothetical protein M3R32_04120 [Chloroflexota bacterium]|nr:hypothetical protein [Chloroflexota bacterium]